MIYFSWWLKVLKVRALGGKFNPFVPLQRIKNLHDGWKFTKYCSHPGFPKANKEWPPLNTLSSYETSSLRNWVWEKVGKRKDRATDLETKWQRRFIFSWEWNKEEKVNKASCNRSPMIWKYQAWKKSRV